MEAYYLDRNILDLVQLFHEFFVYIVIHLTYSQQWWSMPCGSILEQHTRIPKPKYCCYKDIL